jgi:hypothetical protein
LSQFDIAIFDTLAILPLFSPLFTPRFSLPRYSWMSFSCIRHYAADDFASFLRPLFSSPLSVYFRYAMLPLATLPHYWLPPDTASPIYSAITARHAEGHTSRCHDIRLRCCCCQLSFSPASWRRHTPFRLRFRHTLSADTAYRQPFLSADFAFRHFIARPLSLSPNSYDSFSSLGPKGCQAAISDFRFSWPFSIALN